VDLLGFSAALTNASAERRSKLRGLLMYISGLSGDFSVTPREVRAGTHPEFRGAVTGFSDTVVFSWPLDALRTNAIPTRSALAELQRKVCLIAGSARDAGVLVRGGITVGNLYHRNGVVIGEALIEAHELESRVANYPRILVSPRVLEHADFQLGATELMKDRDGLWCFDYIFMFFLSFGRLRPYDRCARQHVG
jgi:hypothetical protein